MQFNCCVNYMSCGCVLCVGQDLPSNHSTSYHQFQHCACQQCYSSLINCASINEQWSQDHSKLYSGIENCGCKLCQQWHTGTIMEDYSNNLDTSGGNKCGVAAEVTDEVFQNTYSFHDLAYIDNFIDNNCTINSINYDEIYTSDFNTTIDINIYDLSCDSEYKTVSRGGGAGLCKNVAYIYNQPSFKSSNNQNSCALATNVQGS